MERQHKIHVVILGGGFGGVRAALRLDSLLPSECKITLIDKRDAHVPQRMLYEIAAVALESDESRGEYEKIKKIAAIPYQDIFRGTRVIFHKGNVCGVSLREKKVTLEGSEILFDYIIIALGSETNYFEIPGLKERSYGLKDVDEALNLRNAICELFVHNVGERINIVIGGGGFTGIELAGELSCFIKKCADSYNFPQKKLSLTIVEAGPCILPGSHEWVQKGALKRIQKLGVRMIKESPIASLSDHEVVTKKGGRIPADILIWTAGVRANSFVEKIDGASLAKGCLTVDDYLRLPAFPYAYGIGDSVYCFDVGLNCPVPATAQRAIDQANIAAANIAREINGEKLISYVPRYPVFVVPIGGKYALADFMGLHLSGFFGWAFKMLIGLKYLLSILPWGKAVSVWLQGLRVYVRND